MGACRTVTLVWAMCVVSVDAATDKVQMRAMQAASSGTVVSMGAAVLSLLYGRRRVSTDLHMRPAWR
jgi:hypothetical protein